jgi:carboxyl-terminal processing protease
LAALLGAFISLIAACSSLPYAERGVVPAPVVVADGSAERRALNARVWDTAVGYVTDHYYDRDLRGVDWLSEAALRREAALAEPTEAGFYGRLNNLFDLMDDRHLSATSPAVRARDHASDQGQPGPSFGLTATRMGDAWFVTRVRPDGPAAVAGVEVGWKLIRVDGLSDFLGVSPRLGHPTPLLFEDETGRRHERTIAPVQLAPRAPHESIRRDGILILRFDAFDPEAVAWLEARLRDAEGDPPRAVILDVRDNGGGQLSALSSIVGLLHRDRVDFAVQNRRLIDVRFVTSPREVVWEGPLIVLTGPASASASELLAAHVQDSGRGRVVGETTAGAVIGSRDVDLPDGGVMSLSLFVILTAERYSLEGEGVKPDIEVIPTLAQRRAGEDVVLEAAIAALLADEAPD